VLERSREGSGGRGDVGGDTGGVDGVLREMSWEGERRTHDPLYSPTETDN
jgi:hypothetical protein